MALAGAEAGAHGSTGAQRSRDVFRVRRGSDSATRKPSVHNPPKRTLLYMSETLPLTEARARLGNLVRRTAHTRERITITDHGQPAAVLINPAELADLEDALALVRYRERQATGATPAVPHDDVRARLGLERG